MLYLEDYLEMIEHLPQELRDRLTEMREMDLQVQNAMDSLNERVKQFFLVAKKIKPAEREVEYEKIKNDYGKALEDAEEKVNISDQIYDLVVKYVRKLDQELSKFKMELEADNAGITEVLEQRSLELDNPIVQPSFLNVNSVKVEKRKQPQLSSLSYHQPEKQAMPDKALSSLASEVMRETMSGNRVAIMGHSPSSSSTSSSCSVNSIPERTPVLPQSKTHPFGGGNALAAAASQAIAATQQSLKRTANQSPNAIQQGRRTASLRASYEAINSGFTNLNKEFTLGAREMPTVQTVVTNLPSVAAVTVPVEKNTKSTKKASRAAVVAPPIDPLPPLDDSEDSSALDENGLSVDWSYDPNEPRYCLCHQVSYGDMVACDNTECPFEWFHYPCVGISQPPKGKWFCPQCASNMKQRRGRKEK